MPCIYCGCKEATTRDHIPPRCFFPEPRPSNLITVPSCAGCNDGFSRDDEIVRDILVSLDTTENHAAVQNQLASNRNRSFDRPHAAGKLKAILDSIKMVDCYTESGIFLKTAAAFNLDRPAVNRFLSRITRALLHHETGIGYVDCRVEWQLSPSAEKFFALPRELTSRFKVVSVTDIFTYAALCLPTSATSLWILTFYQGVEFMSLLRSNG